MHKGVDLKARYTLFKSSFTCSIYNEILELLDHSFDIVMQMINSSASLRVTVS